MIPQKTRYHLNNLYFSNPLRFGSVRVLQIGRRYCEPSEVVSVHPHLDWFELTIVSDGKGSVITNEEETCVKSGDIYLSFPCDIHEIRAERENKLEYDFFAFCCDDEELNGKLTDITHHFRGGNSRVFQDEKIAWLVKNALAEFFVKDRPYSELLLTDFFRAVLVYLIRDFNAIKRNTADVSDAEILCFQLMNYLDTHIYSLKNLEDISEKFNYNYSYLSRVFRKMTGQTLRDYYRHRKMEVAKALILEKKKKLCEIAALIGYEPYSFSKAFKTEYGVSPKSMQLHAR